MKNYDYIGQISNKLKDIFDKGNNVSKETIYTYIYVFCKGELKKELISRFHKKSRLPRGKDPKFLIYEVFQNALKKIVPYLGIGKEI